MIKRVSFLWLCLTLFSVVTQAAYITDKLVAGLYEKPKVSDKPIKALNSGTPLEVISRKNGFVKVRTSDGTKGWVESTYLTDEKPARSMLLDVQSKVSILQKKLQQAQGRKANDVVASSSVDQNALQEKLAQAQGTIAQLELQLKAEKLSNKQHQENQKLAEREAHQQLLLLTTKHELALQVEKEANDVLRQKIQQVADILKIPVSKPVNQSIESVSHGLTKTNYVAWILLVVGIMLGFLVGFMYMQRKVSLRFGSSFRL